MYLRPLRINIGAVEAELKELLSKKRKKEAADFVAYLRVKEEIEATKEIISDKDFLKSIIQGDEDFRAGRVKKWSEVREDV